METVLVVLLACFFLLLVMVGAYCLDCLLEMRKVKLLEELANDAAERAREKLVEDYENIADWIEAAEKLKDENELMLESLKELEAKIRNMRHRNRDELGRFSKKS